MFNLQKTMEEDCESFELDQAFMMDHSLMALSNNGLLKLPDGIVECAEPRLTLKHNQFTKFLSPSTTQSKMQFLSPSLTITAANLTSPVEGKSSTPYERMNFQKPLLASLLDVSCIDLTAANPSWEVSVIKPFVTSPEQFCDYNKTWSPSYLYGPATFTEISSMTFSGTPPPDGQRPRREFSFQDLNKCHDVLELTDEQLRSLSKNLKM